MKRVFFLKVLLGLSVASFFLLPQWRVLSQDQANMRVDANAVDTTTAPKSGYQGLTKSAVDYDIYVGETGRFGQTTNWRPDPGNRMLWIESMLGSESGGFSTNGNLFTLWSPGDRRGSILEIYDEDSLPNGAPKFAFKNNGNLEVSGESVPEVIF